MLEEISISDTVERTIREFKNVGFTEYEAKAYIGLLKNGVPVTGYGLSKISGVPHGKIYQVLSRLVDKGIVQKEGKENNEYVALPPKNLVKNLRQEYDSSLNILDENLEKINTTGYMTNIWNINDRKAILNKSRVLIRNSNNNLLLSLWKDEIKYLAEDINSRTCKGVKTLLIIHGGGEKYLEANDNINYYNHFLEKKVIQERGKEIIVVADRKEAVAGNINEMESSAFSTTKLGIINIISEFILHEALLWKLYSNIKIKNDKELEQLKKELFHNDDIE